MAQVDGPQKFGKSQIRKFADFCGLVEYSIKCSSSNLYLPNERSFKKTTFRTVLRRGEQYLAEIGKLVISNLFLKNCGFAYLR